MRRRAAPKRIILPDPLFGSELVAKFINSLMLDGKKSIAEKITYGALQRVVDQAANAGINAKSDDEDGESGKGGSGSRNIREDEKARKRALSLFAEALENISPNVEVKSRRVGGSTYQVPVEVRANRRMALAMRWMVEFSSKRNEKTMVLRLAGEILDALQHRGNAVKKREDTHRMAQANQAFAHYRW